MKLGFLALALAVCLCSCHGGDARADENSVLAERGYETLNYDDMKAMWISQYDLSEVYTDQGKQRERSDFAARVEKILDNVVSVGINTVIVQVRPFADSMYPSEYYPASSFVTGDYGRSADYDPFEIIVEGAHERDLSIHAWINPLRAMTKDEIKKVSADFKIREWYDAGDGLVSEVSGRLYLDPAYDEVRGLISDGAAEIVKKYNVDGIHMDDYFYPTVDGSFDERSYSEYKAEGGEYDRAQFRRDNINALVREIYSAVKSENEDVLFGISPSGVTANNYNKLYADVAGWCGNEGYIDYICPQVYFGFEHSTCGFVKVCREFADMVKGGEVRLIIGMTLGKALSEYDAYAGEGKYEWRDNKDILARAFEYTRTLSGCEGVSYFCYQYFFDPLTGEAVRGTSEEVAKLLPLLKA